MAMFGIIGGTGMYDADFLSESKEISVDTPYGKPSEPVTTGKIGQVEVVLIPRHAKGHKVNPTNVNYRANIWAMKQLGVTHILAPCAVGSLKEEIKPGDLVFSDQFIDRTTKRASTFYDKQKVCHISMAEPFCPELRKLLADAAKKLNMSFHEKGTNVVMEGPRFSTKAESELYRSWKADTINMTMVPECTLAREAEICYAPIAQVTDYDCWRDRIVTADEIINTLKANVEKTKKLLEEVIPRIPEERKCGCKTALTGAFV
ncbi:S-methyl-5'-thioadenosine phosphorylase [Candidatus Woesearchaeota archaeon]|nr:S-methyl-5'-thioadenosine phosphorylase [Candidatus Woesearchaeota archaeon]|tara:strand:+ start:4081 stop:4863 length:783 start_codon:yes stop_codon:yes gene_type:complete